ncbi:MAG: hypothetical protein RL322_106, partial [Pseudomonadota bacterium]
SGTQNSNTNPALLANETDPDHANEALSIKSVTAISGGTVTLTNEGHVSFVPTAHFNGQAQFSYVVTDGLHDSAPVTATVNVTPVEDAPVVSIKRVVEEAVQEVSAAPQPGVTLRVEYSDVDGHTHAGANPTYQWFANGVAIPGATATDLVLSQSLVGKLIGVSVAFADGGGTVYQHPGSTTTNPTATQTLAFAVAASNVAPTLTGDPLSPQSGAIGQAVSIPAGARFADAGDTLIFSARLSTGEALPSGVSIDPATGTVSGTLNAGWLGSKTLLVTATDTAGNSVSDSVVVTTTAPAGVYLAGKMIEMTDFGAANAFAAPGAAGFDSAAYASMSAGRLQLTLSENQGGVSTGAELNGVNLRALIDRDGNGNRIDSTGVAPYLSLPIDSILATGQSVQSVNGSMTLSVTLSVLGQVQQVSATVNVTLTQTASAVQLSVNGAQTVPLLLGGQPFGASISFGAGDLLGASSAATDSASGQDMLDLYLMGLLSRLGQTTSSFIDDYLTGQMTFSVSFSGLPVFDRSGQALAGLDATVVVADAPNRAPALTLPAMDVSAQQPIPALVVPVGSEIKLGSVLAAGLQAAPNGEAHLLLVSAPTAGKLVLDGGAVVFPSPSGALPAGFVLVDGQVMLKLMAADLGRLTYRAPSMAGSATVTAPELASVVVQAMDAHGAKSPPVLYGLGLDGAPSAVMVMAVGEADRLLDLDGDALIDGDGKVEALFTGNATEGKVIALPDPALGVLNIREGQTVRPVALNEVISKTAILSFDPVNTTAPNTPLRDDVLLEINQGGQLIYRRFDVQLTNQGSELAPTLGLTDVTTSIPEGTVIAAEGVKVATIANSGTPSAPVELTLSGPDQALFQIVGTELRFKPGSAPLDYETKTAYRVQVNADNPAIGLAGSIEASQSYELQVGNIADTLELASNSLTLTDVGTSGAARTVSLSGSYATSGGLRTLQFESTGTQNGLSLSNLRQLFDADPNSGVSPTLSFSLGDTAAVVTGTHTVHARATLVGEVIGVSLPLEMAFSAQVSLERDLSGQLKAVLPAQTVQLKMSAAGLDIATISLNNLDADTFALVSGTNQTASIELKLWNLIDKAGDRDIALSQLGTTGAIALAGAMVAGGLGDRTLQELVTLAKDVTTI